MGNALCSRGKLPGRMEKLRLPAKAKNLQKTSHHATHVQEQLPEH